MQEYEATRVQMIYPNLQPGSSNEGNDVEANAPKKSIKVVIEVNIEVNVSVDPITIPSSTLSEKNYRRLSKLP